MSELPDLPAAGPPEPPPHPHHPPPPAVAVLQVLSLLCFVGYAVLGMLKGVPLDRYVLAGIIFFGVGVRPESLGQILRGFTSTR